MIHIEASSEKYGKVPLCDRAMWDGLTQRPEENECWECASIAGVPQPGGLRTMHSVEAPAQRFYVEGETLHAEPGCYVDGSMSLRACTWKAVSVVRSFGACSHEQFNLWAHDLEHVCPEDGSESYLALGEEALEHLNAANLSDTHFWTWDEGSLVYREVQE